MEKSKNAGTSLSVPSDILGSYEELRWMEPHTSSPSPCWINDQEAQEKRCLKFYICSDVPHTQTQTHTHTHIQTHRHTDTHTHRHTDTHTHTLIIYIYIFIHHKFSPWDLGQNPRNGLHHHCYAATVSHVSQTWSNHAKTGRHQNSWRMDVHSYKDGGRSFGFIPICLIGTSTLKGLFISTNGSDVFKCMILSSWPVGRCFTSRLVWTQPSPIPSI